MEDDNNYRTEKFSFIGPAVYQIKVQGELRKKSSGHVGGMQIEISYKKENNPISTLTGSLQDQAALSGILNSLYEMHLVVLSVKILSH